MRQTAAGRPCAFIPERMLRAGRGMGAMASVLGTPNYLYLDILTGQSYGVLKGSNWTGASVEQTIAQLNSGVTDIQVFHAVYFADLS